MIKVTENAKTQALQLMRDDGNEGYFIRVGVKGGGCSGFQYEFTFDNKLAADDLKHENILIDKASADLLKGSEVDFVS